MSNETEAAKSELEHSNHALASPMQAILNNQELLRLGIEEQVKKLGKLETAVLGDEEYHQEGILPTLNNHERRIRSLEHWRLYLLGAFAALGVVLTLVLAISKLLTK